MFNYFFVLPTPSSAPSRWAATAISLLILWHRTVCFLSYFLCDACCFVFSLICVFSYEYAVSARHFPPPSWDCGSCHLSISCGFRLFVSPPATMVACGRVLMLVSLVLAPVFSFNSPCFISPPPATLAVRGRVLTVVCYVIAPFSSRPPPPHWRYAARFGLVVCLHIVSAFPSIIFFAFFLAS